MSGDNSQDVRNKYVPPSVNETAFNCPHCGALAKQYWFSSHAEPMKKDSTPRLITPEELKTLSLDHIEEGEQRESIRRWFEKLATGRPVLEKSDKSVDYYVGNLAISRCYNCDNIAIWVFDRLYWPQVGNAPAPSPDIPDDIRNDYDEASAILDKSPRGAAALLRLGIQKLCKHLGETGENINDDIAALVRKGLDPRVQQALDVVRVVGNNAVHPGQIDLRDDRATAEKLFSLTNLVVEIMISQPKHVKAMYDSLPLNQLAAIQKRDGAKKP